MRRKREGASLIYVIIIFMFVSMVSVSMLSMVSANYRGRVVENKRIENLYGADSGIDVAYNIIGKTFDAASMYGYYCRKELFDKFDKEECDSTYKEKYQLVKNDIETLENKIIDENKKDNPTQSIINNAKAQIQKDNEKLELVLNEEFKIAFTNFIEEKSNDTNSKGMLKDCLINGMYVNSVTGIDKFTTVSINYPNNEPDLSDSEVVLSKSSSNKDDVEINKYSFDISVISNFESNTNVVTGTNTRIIQANYILTVPNYDDVFFGKGSTIHNKYLALEGRSLTVGGNMNVENVDILNIDGNIFVQGNDEDSLIPTNSKVYDKYYGGIKLNKSNINFKKAVITRNTFNIQDSTNVDIEGNLYAENLYAGKIDKKLVANDPVGESTLNVVNPDSGEVILNNDLALKANNTKIKINDFYGINDKTVKDNSVIAKEKNSSSIIVNGNENSAVEIKQRAYIMGVAYIDTKGKIINKETGEKSADGYKTGESVAIRGNYRAYSVPDINERDDKFSYYEPLNLLDKDDSVTEVDDKSTHFFKYWQNRLSEINTGGINLPDDTWYTGTIVYKDSSGNAKVKNDNTHKITLEMESNGIIFNKRKEFAKQVYRLGQEATIYDYNNISKISVDSLMDFTSLDNEYKENRDNEKAIFEPNINKTIVIKGDNSKGYTLEAGKNVIEINSVDGVLNAVIATNGDIIIDGDVTFNGSIICNGNLDIKNNSDVNINYHSEIVDRIQYNNEELFKNVFGGNIIYNDNSNSSNEFKQDITTNYDLKKFLKTEFWKINK